MKIAVLGCGSIGRRLIRNLLTLGHGDVIPFDPAQEAREQVQRDCGLQCVCAVEQIWAAEPHIAFVMTPPAAHIELATEAVSHNCHLFVEKPLSHTLEGLEELAAEIEHRGLISMVGCNMRFHPGPRTVKSLIQARTIGRVIAARFETASYLPDWRPRTDYRQSFSAEISQGGAILECIHELDLALWLLGPGGPVGSAVVQASNLGIEVDGLAEILLKHNSGSLSSIHLSFIQRDYNRNCKIVGETGTIYWNFDHPWIEIRRGGATSAVRYDWDPSWELNQMYTDQLSYFHECVEKCERSFHTVRDSIETLRSALRVRAAFSRDGADSARPN